MESTGGIDHAAHAGGVLAGVVLGCALRPRCWPVAVDSPRVAQAAGGLVAAESQRATATVAAGGGPSEAYVLEYAEAGPAVPATVCCQYTRFCARILAVLASCCLAFVFCVALPHACC